MSIGVRLDSSVTSARFGFQGLNWKTLPSEELVQSLLVGEHWVAYRTMTDFLGKAEEDIQVRTARQAISEHPLIKKILTA